MTTGQWIGIAITFVFAVYVGYLLACFIDPSFEPEEAIKRMLSRLSKKKRSQTKGRAK